MASPGPATRNDVVLCVVPTGLNFLFRYYPGLKPGATLYVVPTELNSVFVFVETQCLRLYIA
jgi:hypothetical protein